MKIVITASGKEQNSLTSQQFGRCPYFAFYNDQSKEWSFEANPAAEEPSGAGIKAAQHILDKKAEVLLSGEIGPKAWQVLGSSQVKVYQVPDISLKEALNTYKEGKAQPLTSPTTSSHSGKASSSGTWGESFNEKESSACTTENSEELNKKRIAIATDNDEVSAHFGRCEGYTIVDYDENKIQEKFFIPNPGHEPGFLPRFLNEKGVHCIVSGGMGPKAQNLFSEQGIEYILGISGPVENVVENLLSGQLTGGDSFCSQNHSHGHGHGHHGCHS